MNLVPSIIEEMTIFKKIMQAHPENGDMYHMEA